MLRIDTSGESVNYGAVFNKLCISCSPKDTIFHIPLYTQLLILSIDINNNAIDPGITVILCHKLEIVHFSHIFV